MRSTFSVTPLAGCFDANEPSTLRVPDAPAYLPVPPVIFARPLISTDVGPSASLPHAVDFGVTNSSLSESDPPLSVASPARVMHLSPSCEA